MPKKDEVTVTLTAPHEHAGQPCEAGDKITVRRRLLPLLERFRVIAPQGAPEPAPTQEEPHQEESPADGDDDTPAG